MGTAERALGSLCTAATSTTPCTITHSGHTEMSTSKFNQHASTVMQAMAKLEGAIGKERSARDEALLEALYQIVGAVLDLWRSSLYAYRAAEVFAFEADPVAAARIRLHTEMIEKQTTPQLRAEMTHAIVHLLGDRIGTEAEATLAAVASPAYPTVAPLEETAVKETLDRLRKGHGTGSDGQ